MEVYRKSEFVRGSCIPYIDQLFSHTKAFPHAGLKRYTYIYIYMYINLYLYTYIYIDTETNYDFSYNFRDITKKNIYIYIYIYMYIYIYIYFFFFFYVPEIIRKIRIQPKSVLDASWRGLGGICGVSLLHLGFQNGPWRHLGKLLEAS